MAAAPVTLQTSSSALPFGRVRPDLLTPTAQLLPSLSFLAMFFALPALCLIGYSLLTQSPQGKVGLPPTLEHYRHFLGTPLYTHVLWTTLRISLCTTAIAALLA